MILYTLKSDILTLNIQIARLQNSSLKPQSLHLCRNNQGFAVKILVLAKTNADKELKCLLSFYPEWLRLIDNSFLSLELKEYYKNLVEKRLKF